MSTDFCSMSAFLPSIKEALSGYLADLALTKHRRAAPKGGQEEAPETVKQIPIYIGDLPPTSPKESYFPSVVLLPLSGWAEGGEFFEELGIMASVYSAEKSDFEAQEMELSLLLGRVTRFLREAMDVPVAQRFTCLRDERGRYMRWQRTDLINQPIPFAQATLVSLWSMPGWQ